MSICFFQGYGLSDVIATVASWRLSCHVVVYMLTIFFKKAANNVFLRINALRNIVSFCVRKIVKYAHSKWI